jgi:hypothetical protein
MTENRFADHAEAAPSRPRGVYPIAEVLEELMKQYPARFLESPVAVAEKEALAV